MREIAYGSEKDLLGVRRSYVIVSAVPGDALERCGSQFMERHSSDAGMIAELTSSLVGLVARLHLAGFVHRDLYASHVFLYEHDGVVELNLIDLARAFRPSRRLFRWRVKDLSQLKYSMPAAWVAGQWDRFVAGYLEMTGQKDKPRWEAAISARVERMRRRQRRHESAAGRSHNENSPDN